MTKKQVAKAAKEYAAKNWDGSSLPHHRIEQIFLDGAALLQVELKQANALARAYETAAKSWMSAYDKLKEQYEPLALSYEDENWR